MTKKQIKFILKEDEIILSVQGLQKTYGEEHFSIAIINDNQTITKIITNVCNILKEEYENNKD